MRKRRLIGLVCIAVLCLGANCLDTAEQVCDNAFGRDSFLDELVDILRDELLDDE